LELADALAHPYILASHPPFSPHLLHCAWKKEKRGEKGESKKEMGNKKTYWGPIGIAIPSSLSHGRAGLEFFHCYAEPFAKTGEGWVYVDGRAQGMSGAGGPHVPCACGRIGGVLYDFLRAGI
jgi:hypothetical protein